jgi:hypothetical protein
MLLGGAAQYGVFDSDASTQAVIRDHAAAMAALA